jgi:glutamyl-Q tRNA(Asp) synthetase
VAALGYVGRFAPSPTGPLHFGSLVAAVGSFCEARARGGLWLLRMEDVDAPRCVPGAAASILRTLERFGLAWDGEVVWQSRRLEAYREALARLEAGGWVYGCGCTRREIADSALAPDGGRIYPGTCRGGLPAGKVVRAWRLRVPAGEFRFEDAVQGPVVEEVSQVVGDFVLLRADGLFAYQLAVVVDDAAAGVTHVVRGADLLDSTARQIVLQDCLSLPRLHYAHLPVVVNAAGEKLSKQTLARAVDEAEPGPALFAALTFLGQDPPVELAAAPGTELLAWAAANWRLDRVPRTRSARAPDAMAEKTSAGRRTRRCRLRCGRGCRRANWRLG